jgi:hypothetical protein
MSRASPLTIDHFMEVIGLGDVGRLQTTLPGRFRGLPPVVLFFAPDVEASSPINKLHASIESIGNWSKCQVKTAAFASAKGIIALQPFAMLDMTGKVSSIA